ncbi:MAG TPA: flagellar export protein FliJ [Bacillota bacterium]|nr:flagellar export protein FliJ [Bacillota bacterium]
MAESMAFHKILHVRENEKSIALREYNQSLDLFEQVATELYQLLKKKENAEESYDMSLQNATSIEKIKEQALYIEMLNEEISSLQEQVQRARTEMEWKQKKLTDAHVEVKKFQKLIDHRKQKEEVERKKIENTLMDEISVTQFLSHKNR